MLARNVIPLGSAPAEEESTPPSDANFIELNQAECRAYVEAIKLKCGEPPEGAALRIEASPVEGLEVIVEFDPTVDEAMSWAYGTDANAPTRWDEVGMSAPSTAGGTPS